MVPPDPRTQADQIANDASDKTEKAKEHTKSSVVSAVQQAAAHVQDAAASTAKSVTDFVHGK